ncbi:Hypothetical_protein [Hexamita inflata]|uniref:Hypothetical_protein n=1 Tax=Hexamita inflata TaxID=28002 RepID=A0AA86U5V0_9EUKA|nr:Hypothetical protein HINF_LOCUS28171 [Hexamita inflata]
MFILILSSQNKCESEICCQLSNINWHLVQGECETCYETYDYMNQICTTCEVLYGQQSYYMDGNCHCDQETIGLNTYCDDCRSRQMIVKGGMCVQCTYFDKYAIYDSKNTCKCVDPFKFQDFKCIYKSSTQTNLMIISCVLCFALLVSIALLIAFCIIFKRKYNSVEFRRKKNFKQKQKLIELQFNHIQIEQNQEVLEVFVESTTNDLIIVDEINNMQQIEKEIEIKLIDEIKETEVYLYSE